jgi:glycosyltransferase involved in cell wall biosynthesis
VTTIGIAIPSIPPRGNMLRRALGSATRQHRMPDAISVVMDADGEGAAATRNRAWRALTTDFVAFLDDDDELYAHHLDALLACALENEADLVYPWFDVEGGTDPLAVMHDGALQSPLGVPFGPEQAGFLRDANFIPVTFLVRRWVLEDTGGFPTDHHPEDWAFLVRALDVGAKIVHLPERTWAWHHHLANTSGVSWNGTVAVGATQGRSA